MCLSQGLVLVRLRLQGYVASLYPSFFPLSATLYDRVAPPTVNYAIHLRMWIILDDSLVHHALNIAS